MMRSNKYIMKVKIYHRVIISPLSHLPKTSSESSEPKFKIHHIEAKDESHQILFPHLTDFLNVPNS